ncbi:MAG: hypothetical protein ACXU8S_18420, partial [Phenylobacterium sp.]
NRRTRRHVAQAEPSISANVVARLWREAIWLSFPVLRSKQGVRLRAPPLLIRETLYLFRALGELCCTGQVCRNREFHVEEQGTPKFKAGKLGRGIKAIHKPEREPLGRPTSR